MMKNVKGNKPDRKTIEKNRRIHMKSLCFKLATLIPSQYFGDSKEASSQLEQLDIATAYIIQLRENIKELKMRRVAMETKKISMDAAEMRTGNLGSSPMVDVRDVGSSLQVFLVSEHEKNFMLYNAIAVLEEEGAEVLSSTFSTVGDKVFHSLQAQAKISRVGVETTRLRRRLLELVPRGNE